MTERMINNRLAKIEELKGLIDDLKSQMDDLKAEVVDFMSDNGVEEITTAKYKVISKVIASRSFDSGNFKKDHADLYDEYCREITKAYWRVTAQNG